MVIMSDHFEYGFKTSDGLSLYAQGWQPEGDLRGVVCLVHGLGEHSSRYPHLAEALNGAGYAVMAFDLRGHGKSEGKRGHFPSYEVILDDVGLLIDDARERYPALPCFLYGHSLGGGLVLNYALKRKPQLDGVISTAPALRLGFEPPAVKVALGRAMDKIWPAFVQPSGLDTKALSRDPNVVQAYELDPLVHDRASARLFVGFYEAGLFALDHAAELSLPLLLMHGAGDTITSPEASKEFAADAGKMCTLKIWDGLYHEIHNEPEQGDVFATVVDWLNQHIGEIN